MKTIRSLLILTLAVALFGSASLLAQEKKRLSPHETISAVFDKNRVTLVYGRPFAKHPVSGEVRTIWGGVLVPAGKVWRLGADEATMLVTQKAIMLGGAEIPAGAYTLDLWYDSSGEAKLIVDKQLGQWGIPYEEGHELVRVDLKKAPADAPSDQFTMSLPKNPAGGGMIKISWGDTQFTAPITLAK